MSDLYIGLDHVQLAAPRGCEAEARAFYGDVLGMPELEKPEALRPNGGVWFRCGAHELHIGVQADFVPAVKAHPGIVVSDLGKLKTRLAEAGCAVKDDRSIPGVARFHVNDPFGNRLEFQERGD